MFTGLLSLICVGCHRFLPPSSRLSLFKFVITSLGPYLEYYPLGLTLFLCISSFFSSGRRIILSFSWKKKTKKKTHNLVLRKFCSFSLIFSLTFFLFQDSIQDSTLYSGFSWFLTIILYNENTDSCGICDAQDFASCFFSLMV